ncbi:phosphate signaling complex PhoU family protein [Saccharopolyspora sp. NPDC003752]
MREAFHNELIQLGNQLSGMCELAADTMRRATAALLNGDVGLAEQVIEEDATLDQAGKACEGLAQSLLALQTPVASDLRTVLAALYCAVKVERMGGLAVNIAKLVRRNHPARVVPPDLEDQFREMGELDVRMCEHSATSSPAVRKAGSPSSTTPTTPSTPCTREFSRPLPMGTGRTGSPRR